MKYILPYLRPYRRQTALAMVLVAFATVCDLLLPTIMNDILNHGVRQSDFAYIVRCCVWMLAVAAAGLAALLAGRKISCDVVAGFNADLRTDVFSLVNNMTFEEFNAIGAAALLSRSTYDIGTVSWVASMISGSLITIPVLFFGGVILALRKDVTMSLILLLFVPAIFLIVRPISKRIGPLHETSDKYIDIQNDVMRERLHGIRVIRAFNKEASLQQKIADATHVMAENIINANVQMGLLSPAAVLLVNLAGVAILWLGGWRMETGSHAISGGDIFAIIQYLALVANGVLMGGFAIVMLPHARVAAGRIGEIFQATGMQETAKGAEHTFGGEIAFDHVTFRYEGASEAAVAEDRRHRRHGQRQKYARAAAAVLPPADRGADPLRRRTGVPDRPRRHPQKYQLRPAEDRRLFRYHPAQHRDGPPRRGGGGDPRSRRHRAAHTLPELPARAAGASAAAVRQESLRRAEAAAVHRARHLKGRAHLRL